MVRLDRPAHGGGARRMQRALALHRAGKLAEAEAIYAALCGREPQHFDTAYLLAVVLLDQGRPADALSQVEACLLLRGADAGAHRVRGLALARLGRLAEALTAVDAALARQPQSAEAQNERGTLLLALGRPSEAREALVRAIAIQPAFGVAHNNLGNALIQLGEPAAALAAFDAALGCDRGLAEAHNNRGNALKALHRSGAALASYDAALALRPAYPAAHNNRANALRDLGRPNEALAGYDAALALQPDYAEAHHNRSIALVDLGRHSDALAACEAALALAPAAALHATHGMILERLGHVEAALAAYASAGWGHADAQAARGLLLTQLGETAAGCAALEAALDLEPHTTRFFYNLTQCRRVSADDPRLAPMEALLATPAPLPARDRLDLHFGLGKAYADIGRADAAYAHLSAGNRLMRSQTRYDEATTLAALGRLPTRWQPEDLVGAGASDHPGPLPVFILGMPRSGSTLVEQILAGHPDVFAAGEIDDLRASLHGLGERGRQLALSGAPPDREIRSMMRDAGDAYRERLRARAPQARVVTNKLPDNFRLVGLIRLMLPDARILHSRRHPIDTCLSCFATRFTGHQPFTYELGELGRYYATYATVMAHWRKLLSGDVLADVDYERVVGDLEGAARQIVSFCGLDWETACLRFQDARRPVLTASMGQVREPLHRGAVGRWRAYRHHLAPLIAELRHLLPVDADAES